MLRRLGWVGAASLLMISSAQAADIVEAPPAAYDWSGFYVGANIGYAFGDSYDVVATNAGGATSTFDDLSPEGINGGLQLGYNFQVDSIVLGAEADVQAADIDDDFDDSLGTFPGTVGSYSQEIDWFGTVRARLGFAWDNLLIYATGGYAWANVDIDGSLFGGVVTSTWDDEEIWDGYTVGGGLEYGISDEMTVKAEYLYIDLGSEDIDEDTPFLVSTEFETVFHVVRVGLNWRF